MWRLMVLHIHVKDVHCLEFFNAFIGRYCFPLFRFFGAVFNVILVFLPFLPTGRFDVIVFAEDPAPEELILSWDLGLPDERFHLTVD